jgi:hypothetical protein
LGATVSLARQRKSSINNAFFGGESWQPLDIINRMAFIHFDGERKKATGAVLPG